MRDISSEQPENLWEDTSNKDLSGKKEHLCNKFLSLAQQFRSDLRKLFMNTFGRVSTV